MSTPLKAVMVPESGIIFNDCCNCTFCNRVVQGSGHRYSIISLFGVKGSAKDLVENYLNCNVAILKENFGSYVCKECKRLIDRYFHFTSAAEQIRAKLECRRQLGKGMSVSDPSFRNKQMGVTTPSPESPQKKVPVTIGSPLESQQELGEEKSVSTPSSIYKQMAVTTPSPAGPQKKSMVSIESPSATQRQIFLSNPQKNSPYSVTNVSPAKRFSKNQGKDRRKMSVTFRSLNLKKTLLPCIDALLVGNVAKAIGLLHHHSSEEFGKAISAILRKDFKNLTKENSPLNSSKNTEDMDIDVMNLAKGYFKENAPFLWAVTTGAVRKMKKKVSCTDEDKVVMACSILANARSQKANRVQQHIALALQSFHLQKEGFMLLNSCGVTVSLSVTYNAMDVIAKKSEFKIKHSKKELEQNKMLDNIVDSSSTDYNPIHEEHAYSVRSNATTMLPQPIDEEVLYSPGLSANAKPRAILALSIASVISGKKGVYRRGARCQKEGSEKTENKNGGEDSGPPVLERESNEPPAKKQRTESSPKDNSNTSS